MIWYWIKKIPSLLERIFLKFIVFLVDNIEQSFPAQTAVPTHPNHGCFSNYMIFWYKAPESAVLRTVAVIPHHPIIVVFECIGRSWSSIYQDLTILFGPFISFVHFDHSFIKSNIFRGQVNGNSFLGNSKRAEIIY